MGRYTDSRSLSFIADKLQAGYQLAKDIKLHVRKCLGGRFTIYTGNTVNFRLALNSKNVLL